MKEVLKEILKELKYQTKLMENLYEKKDAKTWEMHESMDVLKKELAKHPILMQGEMGTIINSMFSVIGGKK